MQSQIFHDISTSNQTRTPLKYFSDRFFIKTARETIDSIESRCRSRQCNAVQRERPSGDDPWPFSAAVEPPTLKTNFID